MSNITSHKSLAIFFFSFFYPERTIHGRGETIAAEDIMHDIGAISAMSSDSQAMGRVGEVITRTWQTADKVCARLLSSNNKKSVKCPFR